MGLIIVLLLWSMMMMMSGGKGEAEVALFVFGDSLSDVGNNHYLPLSMLRADFRPNGIDYENHKPTGRFSNGRNIIDFLAEYLGFAQPAPCLAPSTTGNVLTKGVSYASGGCGILNETGFQKTQCLSFSLQLEYHKKTISSLQDQLGPANTAEFLSRSLYIVAIGSNDYLRDYLDTKSNDAKNYSPLQFQDRLIVALEQQVEVLYQLGARKIAYIGLGPIGCTPSERLGQLNQACNTIANSWIMSFNKGVEILIQKLNLKLSGASLAFINPYNEFQEFIDNPSTYGFKVVEEACCGFGKLNAELPCILPIKPCKVRDEYVFWDPWHPTQMANMILAKSIVANISHLVH